MRILYPFFSLAMLSFITACSNSGGGAGGIGFDAKYPTPKAGHIAGTAAVGAPLSNAVVKVSSPSCNGADARSDRANQYGVYSVDMGNCAGPYLVSAEGLAGKVFSVATEEDVGQLVNTTPLTHLVAARVLGTNEPDSVDLSSMNFTKNEVDTQVGVVGSVIASLAQSMGANGIDIRSGRFAADGSKLDKLLDAINVVPNGSDLQLGIKGTATVVTIPADNTTAPTGTISESDIEEANEAVAQFEVIKNRLKLFNATLSWGKENEFLAFYDENFIHNGLNAEAEWDDIAWEGMELSIDTDKLALIEMNQDKTEAWVGYFIREKNDDGTWGGWFDVTKLKRESGTNAWKIFGNQVPFPVQVQPALIKFDQGQISQSIARGVNFRDLSWAYDDEEEESLLPRMGSKRSKRSVSIRSGRVTARSLAAEPYSFTIQSADLGISNAVTVNYASLGEGSSFHYFNHSGTKPTCASNNLMCNSFLVASPRSGGFPKVQLSFNNTSMDIYIPVLPSRPAAYTDVPAFQGLAHDENICGDYSAPADFPVQTLRWTLPTGYVFEGWDMITGSPNAYLNHDFERTNSMTQMPFGSAIVTTGQGTAVSFDSIEISLEYRDRLDRAFFLAYSCEKETEL